MKTLRIFFVCFFVLFSIGCSTVSVYKDGEEVHKVRHLAFSSYRSYVEVQTAEGEKIIIDNRGRPSAFERIMGVITFGLAKTQQTLEN